MDYRISERAMVTSCAVGILIVMLGNRRQSLMMERGRRGSDGAWLLRRLFLQVSALQKALQDRLPAAERLPVLRREARR